MTQLSCSLKQVGAVFKRGNGPTGNRRMGAWNGNRTWNGGMGNRRGATEELMVNDREIDTLSASFSTLKSMTRLGQFSTHL